MGIYIAHFGSTAFCLHIAVLVMPNFSTDILRNEQFRLVYSDTKWANFFDLIPG